MDQQTYTEKVENKYIKLIESCKAKINTISSQTQFIQRGLTVEIMENVNIVGHRLGVGLDTIPSSKTGLEKALEDLLSQLDTLSNKIEV